VASKSERNQPGAQRGKRVAQVLYLAFAAAFVVLSTWEVERQVFGMPMTSRETENNCSYMLVSFDEAITRGVAQAALEHTRGKADEVFENLVSAPLAAVEKRCTKGNDVGAFLAATRLRDAAEASVDAQYSTLAPFRAALQVRRNP
jgi:hypothetical protein